MKKKAFAWVGMVLCAAGLQAAPQPNVVIVFLDDSGWADFHPFGNPPYETPNVQKLADEGCRFNRFFVPHPFPQRRRQRRQGG